MKFPHLIILTLLTTLTSCFSSIKKAQASNYLLHQTTDSLQQDSLSVIELQNLAYNAHLNKSSDTLRSLIQLINNKEIQTPDNEYWVAFFHYNSSKLLSKSNLRQSSNSIKSAIKILDKKEKNSEDYALLAACQAFSIKYTDMMDIPQVSSKVNTNAEKSLQLDKNNVRAYYVLCSQNFYTPKAFGGMTRVDEFAKKGLKCKSSLKADSPSWGKDLLYKVYLKYLKFENRLEEEKIIQQQAKKEYPKRF